MEAKNSSLAFLSLNISAKALSTFYMNHYFISSLYRD